MMSSVTLTYSRYQPNQGFRAPVRPMPPQAAEGEVVKTAKPKAPEPLVNTEAPLTTEEEMRELVDRLNSRVNPAEKAVRFRLEEFRRQPRIVMTSGADVLNNFSREDLPFLETYLHDMAGMQFSFVT